MSGTAVQVAFKSSVISKEVIVMINTELEFDVETGVVVLPVAICQSVLRQTGTIAVVKVANVEVYERSAHSVIRSGVDDIPTQVRGRTNRPIVLAYKFLSPRHTVTISVLRHKELQTVEAMADTALQQTLVVDTQTMNSFILVLQNKQRQYMEIQGIPLTATLLSLKVNSLDTNPVRNREGTLMIPLMVGSGGGPDQLKTSIELVWLCMHAPLGVNGTLDLTPPRVDIPISALSVDVQLPESFQVNFTGSLLRVKSFSQRQPTVVNYETGREVTQKDFDFGSMPSSGGTASSGVGVRAKVPKQGRRYLFEKLLVINGSADLSAAYSLPPPNTTEQWSWISGFGTALR